MPDEYTDDLRGVLAICADIATAADELDARGPLTPEERITAWHHTAAARAALDVVLSQMATDALDAMRQLGLEEGITDIGPVHVHRKPGAQRWRGHALLEALGRPLLDRESGEVADAVPVSVLQRVVAGAQVGKEYSRWLTSGLEEVLPGWRRFRHIEEPTFEMKVGRKPKR